MKLTLVSIYCSGKKIAFFIKLPYYNGKAVFPANWFAEIFQEQFPWAADGTTITIG